MLREVDSKGGASQIIIMDEEHPSEVVEKGLVLEANLGEGDERTLVELLD